VIWNLTTLGFVQKLQGHSGCINALALQKDKYLLSGSSDKAIFMWDIENGFNYVYKLDGHTQPITALVSLENKVVSASEDNTIRIWSPSFYLETEENLNQAKSKLIILNNKNFKSLCSIL
jgi:F-box and WD-40 domain protein 1/11